MPRLLGGRQKNVEQRIVHFTAGDLQGSLPTPVSIIPMGGGLCLLEVRQALLLGPLRKAVQ
jgi:hypothetical protein